MRGSRATVVSGVSLVQCISKNRELLLENRASWIFLPPVVIQALLLTLKIPPWLINVPQRPCAWFQGAIKPIWVSLVRLFLKKIRTSFWENDAPAFAAPIYHPSSFIDLANTFLANKRSLKTICTVLGSKSTHMDVTGPTNFKNLGPLFQKILLLQFAALFAIQALLLTSQFSPWLVNIP